MKLHELTEKFAIEAEAYATKQVSDGAPKEDYHLLYTHKLTELIVNHCALLVEGFELMEEVADGEYVDYEASTILKQHFGVQ